MSKDLLDRVRLARSIGRTQGDQRLVAANVGTVKVNVAATRAHRRVGNWHPERAVHRLDANVAERTSPGPGVAVRNARPVGDHLQWQVAQ